MKTGIPMQDLATELQRRVGVIDDGVADTRRITLTVDRLMTVPDGPPISTPVLTIDDWDGPGTLGTFPVNEHAQHQLAQKVGVPQRFFDRLRDDHPDILVDTVNKLFAREPGVQMIRTLDDTVRAFLSNRYRRLDNYDLMERAIVPGLTASGEPFRVMSAGLTDTRMYVKVIWPDISLDVEAGDTVHPGVCISNSEVGAGKLATEPFLFRSFCTNGCIFGVEYADLGLRKMHVGRRIDDTEEARSLFSEDTLRLEDEAFFAMAYDVIKGASTQVMFERIVERVRALKGIEFKTVDPVAVTEKLAKATGLSDGERGSVMAHLIEGGDLSAYGFWNAVTRTAEDAGSYDRATELERLGGTLADWSVAQWNTLHDAASR